VSLGIALFEYLIQVPANRIGAETMTFGQLKLFAGSVRRECLFFDSLVVSRKKVRAKIEQLLHRGFQRPLRGYALQNHHPKSKAIGVNRVASQRRILIDVTKVDMLL
jgi:Putative member of DMT superfamily (DUF486)